jgi:hypothetical protein
MSDTPEDTQPPSPEIANLDTQIAEIRGKTDLGSHEIGRRLVPLYEKKAGLIANQQNTERQKQQAQFDAEREKAGAADIPPEVAATDRAVDQTLRAEWGDSFQQNAEIVQRQLNQIFGGDKQKFVDFLIEHDLDIDAEKQAEAARFLLKLGRKKK